MVKFLSQPASLSTGDRIMKGLDLAVQSIPDMIGMYERQKSFDKIGSNLPDAQKDVWDSLSFEMKEKLAPSIFTSLQKREGEKGKALEKIPKGAASHLKTFYPALAENPEALRSIAELSKRH